MSFVRILEKIYCVIMAPHCILLYVFDTICFPILPNYCPELDMGFHNIWFNFYMLMGYVFLALTHRCGRLLFCLPNSAIISCVKSQVSFLVLSTQWNCYSWQGCDKRGDPQVIRGTSERRNNEMCCFYIHWKPNNLKAIMCLNAFLSVQHQTFTKELLLGEASFCWNIRMISWDVDFFYFSKF